MNTVNAAVAVQELLTTHVHILVIYMVTTKPSATAAMFVKMPVRMTFEVALREAHNG